MNHEKKIDPKHFYSLGEIVREGLIPRINTIPKASSLIRADLRTNKVLNGQMVPRGARGIMYKVKGSNIIKFLLTLDDNG